MRHRLAQLGRLSEDVRREGVALFFRGYDYVVRRVRDLRQRGQGASSPAAPRAGPSRSSKVKRDTVACVPEGLRVYAFGDIHGRADLLTRLFERVEADIDASGGGDEIVLVFLGDYVDRGFQSKDVIDFLISERVTRHRCIYLKGNHEEAFLKFLREPSFGPRWAGYGGSETLTSYGVRPPRTRTQIEEWAEASQALSAALPIEHRTFLDRLEVSASIGDYIFVHAGLRPGRPIEKQTEEDALWIRDEFLNDTSLFEQVVVHGHTPISEPHHDERRVGIDTGAYLTGHLTAACFVRDEVRFLTT